MSQLIGRISGTRAGAEPASRTLATIVGVGWYARAACQGEDLDLFFSNASLVAQYKAKQICHGCRVLSECLESAMAEEAKPESATANLKIRSGVRGGMTSFERWESVYPEDAVRYRQQQREQQQRNRQKKQGETAA